MRMTRAGIPTATEPEGMLEFTTAPAPITQWSPMSVPGRRQTFAPIHTSFPILIFPLSWPCFWIGMPGRSLSAVIRSAHDGVHPNEDLVSYLYLPEVSDNTHVHIGAKIGACN